MIQTFSRIKMAIAAEEAFFAVRSTILTRFSVQVFTQVALLVGGVNYTITTVWTLLALFIASTVRGSIVFAKITFYSMY